MVLAIAALVTWVLTAGGGFVMLGLWLQRRGVARTVVTGVGARPDASTDQGVGTGADVTAGGHGTRFPPGLVFGHFGLAAIGLVVWIIYLFTDIESLAWVAFVLLLPVAVLGLTMFLRWLPQRRAGARTAESRFPVPIVYGHGALAVTTVVLVLLTALGVGGS
jgi:hypothetical protein